MPKVKMTSNEPGAPAGHTVFQYAAGVVYDTETTVDEAADAGLSPMSRDLAEVFVANGMAVYVDDEGNPITPAAKRQVKPAAPPETK